MGNRISNITACLSIACIFVVCCEVVASGDQATDYPKLESLPSLDSQEKRNSDVLDIPIEVPVKTPEKGSAFSLLETLYFLSGPALAFFAWRALEQIKVMKTQTLQQRDHAKSEAKRDELKITLEQIHNYKENILQLENQLEEKTKEIGFEFLEDIKIEIEENTIRIMPPQDGIPKEEFSKVLDVVVEFTQTFNAIEAFSVFFISGIADDKFAFPYISKSYCNFVKRYLPILALINDGYAYNATIGLFYIWESKLQKIDLQKNKDELDQKINKMQVFDINKMSDNF